jgi:integrase/recombinase XerD
MAQVRRRGKKFVLDYRIGRERKRVTLDSRDEAEELCEKFNALKRAQKTDEFHKLLAARDAAVTAEARLTGKSLSDAIAEYAAAHSKRKCERSELTEYYDFKALFKFLSEDKDVHYIREVTAPILIEYQSRLLDKVSPSTCNRRFNSFKHFFNVCVEWKYIDESPAKLVRRQKETPTQRKTWTDEEVVALVKLLKPHIRRPFLFEAIQGTRPGEGPSARVMDYDREAKTLRVYSGKGSSVMRVLYLQPSAQAIVEEALVDRPNLKPGDFIFVNLNGEQLKPEWVTKAVRKARRALGIEEGKVPYGLRHTFATKLVRLNISSEKTRRLMGHASIRTTENYYKLEDKDLRQTINEVAQVFDFQTGEEIKTVTKGHAI